MKRNFLNENDMILTKQFLFEFVTKKLFMFIKIKNVNDRLIYILLCDSNKFNMIFFINTNLRNVKVRM